MNKRKILFVFMIIIITLFTNIVVTLAATKSELQNQKNDINEQIRETQSEINAVKGEVSATMKQIEELNSQISSYQSEINDLQDKVTALEKSISETTVKLQEAEKKYIEQEEGFKNRIVAQYEAGETTYLDVILGGKSLWDMVSNWYVVSEIAELDNQLLEQMEKNKNEIKTAKESLETSKQQVEAIKTSKEQKRSALKNSQAVKEQYVSQLSEEEKALNEELEELKKEQDAITRQLSALENQYSDKIQNLGGTGTFQRPVTSGVITATMYYSSGLYHGALDYGVPVGTPVYAAAEGVVLYRGWTPNPGSNGGFGYMLTIQHANGLRTYYAHGNGTYYVQAGDVVQKGQLIMLSGNTGNSTGPHLHFEVRVAPYDWSTCRRDPRNYF